MHGGHRLGALNYEQSGLLLLLQAGISTECSHSMLPSIHAMFRQKKQCFKGFKRFAMSVTHFYDGVEKFDDSGCANMWKYFVHWEKKLPKVQSSYLNSQQ